MTNLNETQNPSESRNTLIARNFNSEEHQQQPPVVDLIRSGVSESRENSPMSTSSTTGEDVTSSMQLSGEDSEVKSDVESTTTIVSVNESEESLTSPREESQSLQELNDRELIQEMMADNVNEQDERPGGEEGNQNATPITASPSRVPVITFPLADMARLDEMISNPRWVVPVLPGGHLETLLAASIDLAKKDLDEKCEPCQRFYREGLTISFTKILTDDAVSSWKPEIHKAILKNCERLVDLMVVKLRIDWFPLFDLMSTLFNPTNKFHMFNAGRQPDTFSPEMTNEEELYARPIEMRQCKGTALCCSIL